MQGAILGCAVIGLQEKVSNSDLLVIHFVMSVPSISIRPMVTILFHLNSFSLIYSSHIPKCFYKSVVGYFQMWSHPDSKLHEQPWQWMLPLAPIVVLFLGIYSICNHPISENSSWFWWTLDTHWSESHLDFIIRHPVRVKVCLGMVQYSYSMLRHNIQLLLLLLSLSQHLQIKGLGRECYEVLQQF
jgi:hypothetical protein